MPRYEVIFHEVITYQYLVDALNPEDASAVALSDFRTDPGKLNILHQMIEPPNTKRIYCTNED